ncbi:hypothetical protein GCM10029978_105640 [Actinoallomurus acanthiterrae]
MIGKRRFTGLVAAAGLGLASVFIPSGPAAAATYGPYEFISNLSHLCMDATNASLDDGAPIQQWWCWAGSPQEWTMVYVNRA